MKGEPVTITLAFENPGSGQILVSPPRFAKGSFFGSLRLSGSVSYQTHSDPCWDAYDMDGMLINVGPSETNSDHTLVLQDYVGELGEGKYRVHYRMVITYLREPLLHGRFASAVFQRIGKIGLSIPYSTWIGDGLCTSEIEAEGDLVFMIESEAK
jgi:hypothetical protein